MTTGPASIYISYRRSQDAAVAHHLHDALEQRFGTGSSFLDVRDIPAGQQFPAVLREQLEGSRVVLVLIGPLWLAASDPVSHRRRLDDPADWVFQEVRDALTAGDRLVVPVLTGEHQVPQAGHLPEAIAGLASLQARRLRHESWLADFDALAGEVAAALAPEQPAGPEPSVSIMAGVVRATIAKVVGPKYIPSLYVSRGVLEKSLSRHVTRSTMVKAVAALDQTGRDLEKIGARLLDEDDEAEGLPDAGAVRSAVQEAIRDIRRLVTDLDRAPLRRHELLARSTRVAAHGEVIADEVTAHRDALRMAGREKASWRRADDRRKLLGLLVRAAREAGERAHDVERAARPVVAVIERAGRGKTNLLCDFAIRCAKRQPAVFQVARAIGPGPTELRAAVAVTLNAGGTGTEDLEALGARFGRSGNVAVLLDGINENADPAEFARQVRALIKAADRDNIRFVLTCREEYWPLFEPELRDLLAGEHVNQLGKFGPRQYATAVKRYFRHFAISGEIVGEARAALHDPLLLRFFCEAYAGTRFGNASALTEIRRLPLFELYTARKIKQIADLHPEVGPTHVIGDYIEKLARHTAFRGQLSLDRRDVAGVLPAGDITSAGSVYRMLLDEDLIIEESLVAFDVRVGFVYEAFMEYVLSRTIGRSAGPDPAEAGIAWHREHAHFLNRIGVMGFYLAHLFVADRAAFRRLLTFFHDDGSTASLTAIRLALENIDATRLKAPDIEMVLAALVRVIRGPEDDGPSILGLDRFEDRETVHGVLDGLTRVGTASFGLLVKHLMVHAARLRDGHWPDLVWMLETLGERDDRILLLSLWERLGMPDPAHRLEPKQVTRLAALIRRERPSTIGREEASRVIAAIGRRWLPVARNLADSGAAGKFEGELSRFWRLMQQIPELWLPDRGSPQLTSDDLLSFAMATRPATTAYGSGRPSPE